MKNIFTTLVATAACFFTTGVCKAQANWSKASSINEKVLEMADQKGKLKDPYQIFTNPGKGSFTFCTTKPGDYYVVNELGETVERFCITGNSGRTVDVNHLEAGAYVIQDVALPQSVKLVVIK